MPKQNSIDALLNRESIILLIGVVAVSLNLRPAITALAPLVPEMVKSGISKSDIGLLTTIPVLSFSIAGFICGSLSLKLGQRRTLALGLIILIIGIFIRYQQIWFLGSFMIGAGIAFGNVLLPSLIKSRFEAHAGLITGIYSTAINLGSAVGIACAIPLAKQLTGGWNTSLAFWIFPALTSLLLWIPWLTAKTVQSVAISQSISHILLNKRAWQIALHFGALAWVFFSIVAWLPSILIDRKMDSASAAEWFSLCQVLGCITSLTIPVIAAKKANQSGYVVMSNLITAIALLGIIYLPISWLPSTIFILCCGLNASFSMSLLLITKRSINPAQAGLLSALVQAIGYLISAPGPWFTGFIADSSGNWILATYSILTAVIFTMITGFLAGKKGTI